MALVGTSTTASDGTYSFNPPSYPVRIGIWDSWWVCNLSFTQDFSAGNGNTYGTAVQFATIRKCVFNFILSYPCWFCNNRKSFSIYTMFCKWRSSSIGSIRRCWWLVGMNYQDNGHGLNLRYYPSQPNGATRDQLIA